MSVFVAVGLCWVFFLIAALLLLNKYSRITSKMILLLLFNTKKLLLDVH